MAISNKEWPRAFALVDMVSFFASVEKMDFPELKDKPVAVVNGEAGSTIITSSYEARALAINTGTKVKEALIRCPNLIVRPARPSRYAEISSRIMEALEEITPDLEIFSVDECYLELTHVLSLYDSMESLAQHIREVVLRASDGLPSSIGISEGKLTAKFCAKLRKSKTTIVPASEIKQVIGEAPVSEICGIGRKIARYLHGHRVYYCKDLEKRPISILSKRFGHIGRRLYLTCLGHDPEPLSKPQEPKSMGHGKVTPPGTKDPELIRAIFRQLCEKLASRLRRYEYLAEVVIISMKLDSGWIGKKFSTAQATADSAILWKWAEEVLSLWQSQGVYHLQITATHIRPQAIEQLNLFEDNDCLPGIEQVKDKVHSKFGAKSLMPAAMLSTKNSFSVISPAWRPKGARKSV